MEGKEAVPSIIELMDSYYLTKEDWDALLELGVGPMDQDKVKVETQAKATFTRLYVCPLSHLRFVVLVCECSLLMGVTGTTSNRRILCPS